MLDTAKWKAPFSEDCQIKNKGIYYGEVYHIRPRFPLRFLLPPGDYKITNVDYFHDFQWQTYFQVEDDDGWYSFDEWHIFSQVKE